MRPDDGSELRKRAWAVMISHDGELQLLFQKTVLALSQENILFGEHSELPCEEGSFYEIS